MAREALRPYLPKQRYLLEVVPEDPTAVRSSPGIGRLTLLALKFGRSAELRTLIFEWEEDLQVEVAKGNRGLHYIGILVQYLLLVNPELTPDDLSEALKPMGTEAQELPKTYGLKLIEQGRREEKIEIARKLLARGMNPVDVAEATGLPVEEVQELAH